MNHPYDDLNESDFYHDDSMNYLDYVSSLEDQNAELKQQVEDLTRNLHTDQLTNLLNRRGLVTQYTMFANAAKRRGELYPPAVLFIDINHFKAANDTLGHAHGDKLLCEVADILRANTSVSDLRVRLGGDEFVVVLQRDDASMYVQDIIARIRSAAEEHCISLAIGSAVYELDRPTHFTELSDLDYLLSIADKRMYEDKQTNEHR